MAKANVFYRVVKAQKGHRYPGLYAVEKVYIKDNAIYKKEIVHEWDLRVLSEAALARMGGASAYDAFVEEHPDLLDTVTPPEVVSVKARTEEDFVNLTKNKLTRELKLRADK